MKQLVVLFVAVLGIPGLGAFAQDQSAAGAGALTPRRWLLNPLAEFSRDNGAKAAKTNAGPAPATGFAQLPPGADGPQFDSSSPGNAVLPPPPAPPAEPAAGQPQVPRLRRPYLAPPPETWRQAPAAGGSSVPPLALPPAADPTAGEPVFIDPGAMPPGAMPPGAAAPEVLRLRTADPPAPPFPNDMPEVEDEVKPIPASLVFRTRDILRPDLLKGSNYRLAEYAPLIDFRFRFEIETPWGTIPAHGMAMLDLRLRELHAMEYASRIAGKNPMFVEGVAQVVCDTPHGAYLLVTDPVGSISRTAVGLKRLAQARYSPGGIRANCESRRRLACLVGCDPETRNPPLACLLDEMSTNATVGWLAADTSLYFALPGFGTLAANAEFKKMAASRSTREINCELDKSLAELGVPEKSRTKFLESDSYTTTERMAFAYYLRNLIGVENLAALVDGAADAVDESEALAAIQELQILVDFRRTHAIRKTGFVGLPIIELDDGRQAIVAATDYLVDSPRFAELIVRYRKEFPITPTTLLTLGRVSTGAERLLTASGISIAHHRLGPSRHSKAEKPLETALAPGGAAPGPRTQ